MTKRKKILFSVALMLPMLITLYIMDGYEFLWLMLNEIVQSISITGEDVVMALKTFGVILIFATGMGGAILLWDALSKEPKYKQIPK